jgi:5-methylcytosine-specific restriction endonuclease McrA
MSRVAPASGDFELFGREVPEWFGATPDTPAPERVRQRVFMRYGGKCHWTGRKIMPGDDWDLDHVKALRNGGENREANLAPILRGKPHKEKTAQDRTETADTDRMWRKSFGRKKRPWNAGFRKKMNGKVERVG